MKMKRICALLLAGAMVAGCLAGCGNTGTTNTSESTTDSATESTEEPKNALGIDEPVELEVYVYRDGGYTGDPNKLYIWRYLSEWLAEQGYDVTFNVSQSITAEESSQKLNLMLSMAEVPDLLLLRHSLSANQMVVYGQDEQLFLDLVPYLEAGKMPNLQNQFDAYPGSQVASTLPDGGIYSMPVFMEGKYYSQEGCYGYNWRMWTYEKAFETLGLEDPTNEAELLNVLRTIKADYVHESGDASVDIIPMDGTEHFVEMYLWVGLGWYGGWGHRYGANLLVKDGKVQLPSYTEDFRYVMTLLNTMWSEGLVPEDYLTRAKDIRRGQSANGQIIMWGDYNPQSKGTIYDPSDTNWGVWGVASPIYLNGNDFVATTSNALYTCHRSLISADTKYPELVTMIIDHLFSEEGRLMYYYGPAEGEVEGIDGWKLREDGKTIVLADDSWEENGLNYYYSVIRYADYQFSMANISELIMEKAGGVYEGISKVFTDAVTGTEITMWDHIDGRDPYEEGHARAGRYRTEQLNYIDWTTKWAPHNTHIILPTVYQTADEALRTTELNTLLRDLTISEGAKFITGTRPLSEVDEFWKELETIGVQEYLDIVLPYYAEFEKTLNGK